jgi:hypothetical protein
VGLSFYDGRILVNSIFPLIGAGVGVLAFAAGLAVAVERWSARQRGFSSRKSLNARRFGWRRWVLMLEFATLIAVIYWWRADWWAYVDEGNGRRWPKFRMPLWWQVIESCVVGIVASVAVVIGWRVLRRFGRWVNRH